MSWANSVLPMFMAASGQKPDTLPELALSVQIDTTPHRPGIRVIHGFQRFKPSFNRTAVRLNLNSAPAALPAASMLRQRLTLLLLAFLALLQGLTPLLHAHAGESSAGIPHFHVSVGTASAPTIAVNGTRLQVQAAGDTVVDAVDGHSRHESLRLVDAPTEQIPRVDRLALASTLVSPRPGATVPKLPAIGFFRPPARASPILA